MCSGFTFDPILESLPPICIRQLASHATTASAPDFSIASILLSRIATEISGYFTENVPPNPQTKMMAILMPVILTVALLNFASGLNLYYTVQNLAALPQQWLISNERAKAAVKLAPTAVATGGGSKKKR